MINLMRKTNGQTLMIVIIACSLLIGAVMVITFLVSSLNKGQVNSTASMKAYYLAESRVEQAIEDFRQSPIDSTKEDGARSCTGSKGYTIQDVSFKPEALTGVSDAKSYYRIITDSSDGDACLIDALGGIRVGNGFVYRRLLVKIKKQATNITGRILCENKPTYDTTVIPPTLTGYAEQCNQGATYYPRNWKEVSP